MGRVKPKAFWDRHVQEYKKSGMSQQAYCFEKGLKPRSLQYHLRKSRNVGLEKSKSLEKFNGWLPMTIVDEPSKPSSPGGVRLQISKITIETDQGFNPANLAQVLRAIGVIC